MLVSTYPSLVERWSRYISKAVEEGTEVRRMKTIVVVMYWLHRLILDTLFQNRYGLIALVLSLFNKSEAIIEARLISVRALFEKC